MRARAFCTLLLLLFTTQRALRLTASLPLLSLSGTSTVVGFIFGRIPIIGLKPDHLEIPVLAYLGIVGSVISLIIFSFTKPDGMDEVEDAATAVQLDGTPTPPPALEDGVASLKMSLMSESSTAEANTATTAKAAATKDRLVGIGCALFAGAVYGLQFVPATIWKVHNTDAKGNPNATDHPASWLFQTRIFFSQFVGIWLLSLIAFVVVTAYRLITKVDKATWELPSSYMLPSFASGIVWAIAGMGAIFATENLGLSVGYPLTLNCSFIVNSIWTLFVFREYKSKKNIILYLVAAAVNIISSIMLSIGSNGI